MNSSYRICELYVRQMVHSSEISAMTVASEFQLIHHRVDITFRYTPSVSLPRASIVLLRINQFLKVG